MSESLFSRLQKLNRRLRRVVALCRLGWEVRAWPWDSRLRRVGTERPPEEVFEEFRRLHGIDP